MGRPAGAGDSRPVRQEHVGNVDNAYVLTRRSRGLSFALAWMKGIILPHPASDLLAPSDANAEKRHHTAS